MKLIIYPNDNDGISVIHPSSNTTYTIQEIALKDVPAGKPYRIIEHTEIPADRTFREAWEADFTTSEGFGLGADEFFRIKNGE